MNKYYGVTQSHYGHEYRWIFTEEDEFILLLNAIRQKEKYTL